MNQFNVQFARLKKSAQKWIDAPLPASKTTSNSATVTPKKSPKKSPVNVYNKDKIVAVGVNVPKCSLSYVDSENGNVFEQDIEEEIRLYEQALDRIRIRFVSLRVPGRTITTCPTTDQSYYDCPGPDMSKIWLVQDPIFPKSSRLFG